MKIVNNFVYKIITAEQARIMLRTVDIDIFALYDDGAESLIETDEDLDGHIAIGTQFGIEVGQIDPEQVFSEELNKQKNNSEIFCMMNRISLDNATQAIALAEEFSKDLKECRLKITELENELAKWKTTSSVLK